VEEPLRRSARLAEVQAAATTSVQSPTQSPSPPPSLLCLDDFGPDPRTRSSSPAATVVIDGLQSPDLNVGPMHSVPIGDCDDDFFDSQDPAEYTGRASSCDDLTDDDFEDADDELDLDVRLEDLLPWPPELQFRPESLESRRERGHDSRLMHADKGKRHIDTTCAAEMQCGGSAHEEQSAEEGVQGEEAHDEVMVHDEIDSAGRRGCEDSRENWHADAKRGWDGVPVRDASTGMWPPGPALPPFGAGWSGSAVEGGSEPGMQAAGGPPLSSPPPARYNTYTGSEGTRQGPNRVSFSGRLQRLK
jgi:hypothetical protein